MTGERAPDGARPGAGRLGFDVLPERPVIVTVVLFAVVAAGSAVFAHLFRTTTLDALHWLTDERSATEAATSLNRGVLCLLVSAAVAVAAFVGGAVDRRWRQHVGVEAVAASARGESRSISLRATAMRATATWLMSVCAVSVGRESAIIETGGAAGAVSSRKLRGRGDAMALAGIAAAFSAAYHAPIASLLYVEEHLEVGRSRRAIVFAVAGSAGGYGATRLLFDGTALFPPVDGSMWDLLAPAAIALLPAVVAARLFLQLRVRLNGRAISDRFGVHRVTVVIALSLLAGLAVAAFPLAAGNGMEALRAASDDATVTLALGLLVGKLIGTTAALAAGAPGGVLSPSMGVAGGAGLLTLLAAEHLGLGGGHLWEAVVACMAIGVAVGMRTPLVAIVLVPELLGDYRLIVPIALVVGAALVIDRLLDRIVRGAGAAVPSGIYDEDA